MPVSAALSHEKENRFILSGEDKRPADVFIPKWSSGLDAALDMTIVNPLQAALVQEAADISGYALYYACQKKMQVTSEECQRQGVVFLTIVVESLGGWLGVTERSRSCQQPEPGTVGFPSS